MSGLPAPVLTVSPDFSSALITLISDSALSCYMFRPPPIYPKQVPQLFIVIITYETQYIIKYNNNLYRVFTFTRKTKLSLNFYPFHSFRLKVFLYCRKISQSPYLFKTSPLVNILDQKVESYVPNISLVDQWACCANVSNFLNENKKEERKIKETKIK